MKLDHSAKSHSLAVGIANMPRDKVYASPPTVGGPSIPSSSPIPSEGGCGSNRPRREFYRATKRAAWERSGGICEGIITVDNIPERCNATLDHGRFEYDHQDPDWFSKDNELENCVVLCIRCHRLKTARDVMLIAKSKRIRDRAIKAKVSKHPMPGSRRSRFKKKFDGTVVLR